MVPKRSQMGQQMDERAEDSEATPFPNIAQYYTLVYRIVTRRNRVLYHAKFLRLQLHSLHTLDTNHEHTFSLGVPSTRKLSKPSTSISLFANDMLQSSIPSRRFPKLRTFGQCPHLTQLCVLGKVRCRCQLASPTICGKCKNFDLSKSACSELFTSFSAA